MVAPMPRPIESRIAALERRVGIGANKPLVVLWSPEDPAPTDGRRSVRVVWVESPPYQGTPAPVPRPVPRPRPVPVAAPLQMDPDPVPTAKPPPAPTDPRGSHADALRSFMQTLGINPPDQAARPTMGGANEE